MFCGSVSFRMDAAGTSTASINMCLGGTFCKNGADCPNEEDVCEAMPISDTELAGMCDHTDGLIPVGDACDGSVDPNSAPPAQVCHGFYCIWGHCTEVCSEEADCGGGGSCCTVNFRMDDVGDKIASIGMCKFEDGSKNACGSDKDCPAHEVCTYCVTPGNEVLKSCVKENCDVAAGNCSPAGTPDCGDAGAPTCHGDLCLVLSTGASFCSTLCDLTNPTDSGCPEGMSCIQLGVGTAISTGACAPN
jgi:hypothetical protein